MNSEFSIKSNRTDREVSFIKFDGNDFFVELKGGIKASIRVYAYAPHGYELADWFKKLGNYDKPWQGELKWESLEGEFSISAMCNSLGHINFKFSFRYLPGGEEEANIHVGLESEFGQLAYIASRAGDFFANKNT